MNRRMLFAFSLAAGVLCQSLAVSAQTPKSAPKAVKSAIPPRFDVSKVKFTATTDKSPLEYKTGEEMVFTFTLDYHQELPDELKPPCFINWTRSGDDGKLQFGLERISPDRPLVIKTSISEPGFVRIQARVVNSAGNTYQYIKGDLRHMLTFDGGAGADIGKIVPAAEEPADFVEFWKNMRAELDKVPVKAEVVRVPDEKLPKSYAGKFELYKVSVDCAGPRPVTGDLVMPVGAKLKSLPAQVSYCGYGTATSSTEIPVNWYFMAAQNRILFVVNAHGYAHGQNEAYYKEFNKKINRASGYAFNMDENADPKTAYFHGMAFRVMRALDFVKTLPQWNGRDLIAQGGSQGGLQTAWAGSLEPALTVCKPHVTWCCDLAGPLAGRQGGWRPPYQKALDYYDPVFHARHIPATCKLEITRLGLGDYVCPPPGTAAQYNAANCPKSAVWMQNSTHMSAPPESQTFKVEAPAGKGITGRAEKKVMPPLADCVPVTVSPEWVVLPNADVRSVMSGYAPVAKEPLTLNLTLKDGKAQLRKIGDRSFPVMGRLVLLGTVHAERDGIALVGAGIDWWWQCYVNGKPVYGRPRVMPGANAKSSFLKTDWIFEIPVRKGDNKVMLEVILGEHGLFSFGAIPPSESAARISPETYKTWQNFFTDFADPEKVDTRLSVKPGKGSLSASFRSAQKYPAALEYRKKGAKNFEARWDDLNSDSHTFTVTGLEHGEYEVRTVQRAFLGGFENVRTGKSETVTVE